MQSSYWEECIAEAAEECRATLTDEQITCIAGWVEGCHENYGMAHGHDVIPSHRELENARLKQQLKEEQHKVICKECKGSGRIFSQGPYHSSDSDCSNCRGRGRYLPYTSKVGQI